MERKIGNLGLNPISADNFGHSGNSGSCGGPEYYLNDKLNLNIVYSVYHSPKTKEEIAEELGLTLVFIEEKIDYLEENGFLVKTSGERYTTYVKFTPQKYSLELKEKKLKTQLKIAQMLAKEYVPIVREAFGNFEDVYIPGGNRELFEASVIFDALASKCGLTIGKNLSRYWIKTTDGGRYIATVHTDSERADPDYVSELDLPSYWACGHMTRQSEKYPSVCSWAIDSRLSSREGAWQNNLTSDYEYMYEYISGMIEDNAANSEKFARLRSRKFITDDGRPNILIVNSSCKDYENMLPALDEATKSKFADLALELAMAEAKSYPPQMQDLVVRWGVEGLIGVTVAIMVMDILYADGTLSPLDENEKVTSNLIMFCDKLPE